MSITWVTSSNCGSLNMIKKYWFILPHISYASLPDICDKRRLMNGFRSSFVGLGHIKVPSTHKLVIVDLGPQLTEVSSFLFLTLHLSLQRTALAWWTTEAPVTCWATLKALPHILGWPTSPSILILSTFFGDQASREVLLKCFTLL